jgi:EmrB/QacA subfamily drug resistance transporter
MVMVDSTIVTVALPTIQSDLHASQAGVTWIVSSYLITSAGLLLLAGRVSDLVGRRRVFSLGLALFTLASVGCGLADSQAALIVARCAQGVAGAIVSSGVVAIIATHYAGRDERANAMGIYALVISVGATAGVILGGILTELLNWRWIFFINLPLGGVALVLARTIPSDRGIGHGRRLDVTGSVLLTVGSTLAAFVIVSAGSNGLATITTLTAAAGTAIALTALARVERRRPNPILPPRILRIPGLTASNVLRAMLVIAMYASTFIGSLYMQRSLDYGVLATGAAFLPQTVVFAAVSLGLTARLTTRVGPAAPLVAGLISVIIGLVMFATADQHTPYFPWLALTFLLTGVGAGLASAPLLTIAMANVPSADAGIASGMVKFSNQLSGAIAVAALGALASAGGTESLAGYRTAIVAGAVCAAIALCLAGYLLRRRPSELGPKRHSAEPSPRSSRAGVRVSELFRRQGAGVKGLSVLTNRSPCAETLHEGGMAPAPYPRR